MTTQPLAKDRMQAIYALPDHEVVGRLIPDAVQRSMDIGDALARASGIAVTEMALGDVPPNSLLAVATKSLDRALQEGTPVLDDGAFEDRSGVRQLYRATLLPLENEAGAVALVIGGLRCKAG